MNAINKVLIRVLVISFAIATVAVIGNYFLSVADQSSMVQKDSLYLLAPSDRNFLQPVTGNLTFPKDHGVHHQSGIETWQLIGFLKTRDDRRFGFDTTFTRIDLDGDLSRRKSAWATDQVYHLSYGFCPLGVNENYRDRETARQALGLAGYDLKNQTIRVLKQTLQFEGTSPALPKLKLTIPNNAYSANLEFSAMKPLVIPASSTPFGYYSVSRMEVEGRLKISNRDETVHGQAFFDHIWGNLPIGTGQLVRNRFILQLSNNIELSLLQSQRRDSTGRSIETGFVISADSKTSMLESDDLQIEAKGHWKSPASGIRYPTTWQIRIPQTATILDLKPWIKNQETGDSPINWSGMFSVSGHYDSKPVGGFGYVQLSGYEAPEKN